jgi:hypothetical protein
MKLSQFFQKGDSMKSMILAALLAVSTGVFAAENSSNTTNSANWTCTATDGITTWWWSHVYLNVAQNGALRLCANSTGNYCWLIGCQ